ncbi:MAG: hypothetical protein WA269_01850 [Candidatus Udaeobacter sp.]
MKLSQLPSRIAISRTTLETLLFAFSIFAVFAIWTRLNFPPQYDEIAHQSFAQEIANHPGWSTFIDYEGARDYEAQGPLFFALLAAYGHWFGFALPILRTLTMVFAVLLAVSFAKLAEQLDHGAAVISLICLPYFIILGTTAMTDVPCLALTVFAVYAFLAYTDSKSLFQLVVGVLASTAASYIRIDSLYVLVAIGAAFAAQNCLTRQLAIGLIVPFLLRAPLVFIWGGLAAPTAHGRPNPVALGLDLSHVVFSLAVIGLYFWPFALVLRGDWRRSWFGVAVAMLIAVMLCIFWMPKLSAENTDNYAGTIRTVLLRVSETGFRWTIWLVLVATGAAVCFRLLTSAPQHNIKVLAVKLICFLGLIMQALRGHVMYERYLLEVSAFFLLLFITSPKSREVWLWCGWASLLQIAQLFRNNVLP